MAQNLRSTKRAAKTCAILIKIAQFYNAILRRQNYSKNRPPLTKLQIAEQQVTKIQSDF